MQSNRLSFVRLTWFLSLPPLVPMLALVPGEAVAGEPIRLRPGPQLFIDDYLVAETDMDRRVRVPDRLPYPVVTAREDKCFQPYLTVVQDPAISRFRLWYGIPVSESQTNVAYMESADGINWARPHRVLTDPSKIQFGVSVLDQGPGCPDPAKRFLFGWYNDGGLRIATSPDGLDFKPLVPRVVLEHSHDISCIFRDPIRDRYLAMVSQYTTGEGWKGNRRIPTQSTSQDLLTWEKPWRVIEPDSKDEGDTQFYCIGGLIARGDLLVGMLRVLRDDLPAEPGGPVQGLGYTVLVWSRDGRTWQRDREPFLPRNPQPGTWDRAMTWADCQLPVGDEMFIYYGGYARGHKPGRFTDRQIGLARMPIDRYAARVAGPFGARLKTPLVVFAGESITVNARVPGSLQACVRDARGSILPGYGLDDCTVVRGDSVRHPLRWKAGTAALAGKPVQLEFSVRCGELYGFDIVGTSK